MTLYFYEEIYPKQKLYNKIYTVKEAYFNLYKGLRTFKYFKNKQISEQFQERIMLAVTEVNGCEICSYAHTKYALEQGMNNEEIKALLTGELEHVPNDEMPAVIFAQHYADQKGQPSKESWHHIVQIYGSEKALGILGVIRMIMIGNSYGIAVSALKDRIRGNTVTKTTLSYEIKMILSLIPALPISLIHSLTSNLLNTPLIEFKNSNNKENIVIN